MSILDIIKKFLPEKLINIDNRKIDNRKLEIKNSTIVFGEFTINNKEATNEIINEIAKQKDKETLPFQIVHKDLWEEYKNYEEISIRDRNNILLLKKVFPEEEVKCILMARRIVLAFDNKDNKLGQELIKQLEVNFPKKGKKVFNLISSGYFDSLILPFIEVYKAQYGEESYIQEYQKFYLGLFRFFPVAIFVGNNVTESKLEEELIKRLKLKEIPFIRIHAIGESNIKKVEEITIKLEIDKKHNVKDNLFSTPSGIKAQVYEIRLKT